MRQERTTLEIRTRGPGLLDVTGKIRDFVRGSGIRDGLLTVFCQHTSASLVIQENADPDVRADLLAFFEKIAPWDPSLYQHGIEGPDDMPAHIRSALTQSSPAIPVVDGAPGLGTWQGVYLFEHRARPHTRRLLLHVLGE